MGPAYHVTHALSVTLRLERCSLQPYCCAAAWLADDPMLCFPPLPLGSLARQDTLHEPTMYLHLMLWALLSLVNAVQHCSEAGCTDRGCLSAATHGADSESVRKGKRTAAARRRRGCTRRGPPWQ